MRATCRNPIEPGWHIKAGRFSVCPADIVLVLDGSHYPLLNDSAIFRQSAICSSMFLFRFTLPAPQW